MEPKVVKHAASLCVRITWMRGLDRQNQSEFETCKMASFLHKGHPLMAEKLKPCIKGQEGCFAGPAPCGLLWLEHLQHPTKKLFNWWDCSHRECSQMGSKNLVTRCPACQLAASCACKNCSQAGAERMGEVQGNTTNVCSCPITLTLFG